MVDAYEKTRPKNQSAMMIAASRTTTRTYVFVMSLSPWWLGALESVLLCGLAGGARRAPAGAQRV